MPRLRDTFPSAGAQCNTHARSRSYSSAAYRRAYINDYTCSSSKRSSIPSSKSVPFSLNNLISTSLLPSPVCSTPPRPARFMALAESPSLWLLWYFLCNLGLTLYNKSVLVHFPFPYTLTALHALCGSIGTAALARSGAFAPTHLSWGQTLTLLAFSTLYSVNILVSNISLEMVTVPFHQVVRAVTPLFTMLCSALLLGRYSSWAKVIALLPVVLGVALATYGDYYFTMSGFILTLLGTVLAALKTVYTEMLQTPHSSPLRNGAHISGYHAFSLRDRHHSHQGEAPSSPMTSVNHEPPRFRRLADLWSFKLPALPQLSSISLLHLLSPLAFIQTFALAYFTGELGRMKNHVVASIMLPSLSIASSDESYYPLGHQLDRRAMLMGLSRFSAPINVMPLIYISLNGVLAFALNIVSFGANRRVGAVSMSVAANVKQVLTILCAVTIFDLTITIMNGCGIVLTLVGGAWYAFVELKERHERQVKKGESSRVDSSGIPFMTR